MNVLLNKIPFWRGQKKLGVDFGSMILSRYVVNMFKNNKNYNLIERFIGSIHNTDNFYNYQYINDYINNDMKTMTDKYKIINIGGDHSISMGTVPPMLELYPDLRVIWFDAHPDINTENSSMSGNYHGMPVHFLSELCNDEKVNWIKNKLPLKNILYIGIRDIDPYEKEMLDKHNILYFNNDDINKYGVKEVMKKNLDKLNPDNKYPIHLSFDIDGMDPQYCRSTGTIADNGISLNDAASIFNDIRDTNNLVSMDIVEFNPMIGGKYKVLVTIDTITKLLKELF